MKEPLSLNKLYIVNPSIIKDVSYKKSFRNKDTLKQKVIFENLPSLSIAYSDHCGEYVDLFPPQSYKRKTIYKKAKAITGIFVTPESTQYIGVFPHDIEPFVDYDFQQISPSNKILRLKAFKKTFIRECYTIDELQEFYERLKQLELEPHQKTKLYKIPTIPQNIIFMHGTPFDKTPIYAGSDKEEYNQFVKSLRSNTKKFRI